MKSLSFALIASAMAALAAFPASADEASDLAKLQKFAGDDAKGFKLLYSLDPSKAKTEDGGKAIVYAVDNSKSVSGKLSRVAYFLYLAKEDGTENFAFVAVDPFSDDVAKLGVPVKNADAKFQAPLTNAVVKSNVSGVESGSFPTGCNIEFWDCNYGPGNAAKVEGADEKKYDFGDIQSANVSPGYGSMQLHNAAKGQTLIAFNNFRAGKGADLGIGNAPDGNPDWTFAKNASSWKEALLLVLVKTE